MEAIHFLAEDVFPLRLSVAGAADLPILEQAPCFRSRLRQHVRMSSQQDVADTEIDAAIADRLHHLDAKLNLLIQARVDEDIIHYGLQEQAVSLSMDAMRVQFSSSAEAIPDWHLGAMARVLLMLPVFPPVLLDFLGEVIALDHGSVTLSLKFRDAEEEDVFGAYVFQRQRELLRRKKWQERNHGIDQAEVV